MKRLRIVLLALPLVLLMGCATTGEQPRGATGEEEGIVVRVDNDLIPAMNLTVWLVAQTGFRELLGTASPNDVATFVSERASSLGQFRLVAETTRGRDLVSRTFYLTETSTTIRWNTNSNTVTIN